MNINNLKRVAAEEAVKQIQNGMIIGLGSGSTVQYALDCISEKLKSGELKNIAGVPTSRNTEEVSRKLGIPIITLDEAVTRKLETLNQKHENGGREYFIDLTIDGADEVDADLNLIKGGGGAHLREKIIAQATRRLIIIVDETKISKNLGEKWPVPIEVIKTALDAENYFLKSIGARTSIRKSISNENYITDEGNFIIDANFGKIEDVEKISNLLNERAGIVEHGLFLGLTDSVVCAKADGIEILRHL